MTLPDKYAQKCGYVDAEAMLFKLRKDAEGNKLFSKPTEEMIESSILRALAVIESDKQTGGEAP